MGCDRDARLIFRFEPIQLELHIPGGVGSIPELADNPYPGAKEHDVDLCVAHPGGARAVADLDPQYARLASDRGFRHHPESSKNEETQSDRIESALRDDCDLLFSKHRMVRTQVAS